MKKLMLVVLMAVSLVGLAGCPPPQEEITTEPLFPILHGVDQDGNPALITLQSVGTKAIDARNGALLTYQGGGGFASGTVKIWTKNTMNEPQTFPVNITPTNTQVPAVGEEKCLAGCGTGILVAAGIGSVGVAVGHAIGVVHTDPTTGNFDVSSVFGPEIHHAQLALIAQNGSYCLTDLNGPAFYGTTNPDKFDLTTMVSPTDAGYINVDPDRAEYAFHDKVNLEAVANEGWQFEKWVVNAEPSSWTDANASVFMDSNVQAIAYFKKAVSAKAVLDVIISPAGAGSVSVNPDLAEYEIGVDVKLKANPKDGYTFIGWEVNGTAGVTTVDAQVSMDSDLVKVTAKFKATEVTDTTAPVITLLGANPMYLTIGASYVEPGASATDAVDGNVGFTVTGTVNTTVIGTYVLTYRAMDLSGNASTATRTVYVQTGSTTDTVAPVIALRGSATVNLTLGTPWVDPGATATDNVDGNISSRIVATGSVNVNAVGNYVVSYNVSDLAGNRAIEVRRTVFVEDTGSTTKLVIAVTSDANGVLSFTVVNGPANGVAGLELYQNSYPNIQRNTASTNSSGYGSGVLTNFRANMSRTLRCSAVLHPTTGAWVSNESVIVKLNGSVMPLVADNQGNLAFQASF